MFHVPESSKYVEGSYGNNSESTTQNCLSRAKQTWPKMSSSEKDIITSLHMEQDKT